MKDKRKGLVVSLLIIIIGVLIISGLYIYLQNKPSIGTNPDNKVDSSLVDKKTGYIKKTFTQGGKNYIDIDYIEFGPCDAAHDCPDGHGAVINNNPKIRTFEVSSSSIVLIQNGDVISYQDFEKIIKSTTDYRSQNPWDVEIQDNLVVKISEHFLP